jgi:hypothetical protein
MLKNVGVDGIGGKILDKIFWTDLYGLYFLFLLFYLLNKVEEFKDKIKVL